MFAPAPARADLRFRLTLLIAAAGILACLIWAARMIQAYLRFRQAGDTGAGLGVSVEFLLLLPALSALILAASLLDRRQVNWLGGLVMLAGFTNFVTWLEIGGRLGGYASLGRIAGGLYYLGNHGALTQVSPALYRYSQAHGASAMSMLFFVAGLALVQGADEFVRRARDGRIRGSSS
jgi:hypothetical protein